ncbi:XTP/dITP diphosphohydrolase [Candidatus Hakubella thermalkaliphila]|uniref:dITP/XTP pyrophosphatase n=1 Tax=Candidatus Hakubella thermalkaliphila TaxID=2754717 RepID=A0A6V8NP98_9ACTN|nr:XTP/dITP diphosphatase [Candidatus Hakubella thermalkaliphila]GFP20296.1 XTP/dITP diphosphohydrolase [Candidatus Hakubella thermalkaliphila]
MKLILATKNQGKLAEMQELLTDLPFELVSLAAYPELPEIEETGESFAENAAIKAEKVMLATGELVLADDSGLEVDALGGRPGVYSARFAGAGQGDKANNQKLLSELSGVAKKGRTARFQTVVAMAAPGRETAFAVGCVEGLIAEEERGDGGFGYDPLFYLPLADKTFAQMTPQEKNQISHRAEALAKAKEVLRTMAADILKQDTAK